MTNEDRIKFIELIAGCAVPISHLHNNMIFPSVCIAQAIKETGFGKSELMMKYNAPFGVKVGKSKYHFGSGWRDQSYSAKTKEYHSGAYQVKTDDFRAYESIYAATMDYFDLITTAGRYKAALYATDYKECIRAIAPSYATAEAKDHSYSNSIIQIIEQWGLTKYDSDITTVGIYTTSDLNLRLGDNTSTDIITVIPKGMRIKLRGFVPVTYNGLDGYVSAKFLEIRG